MDADLDSMVIIRESNFTGNSAYKTGGVIQLSSSTISIIASEFISNAAKQGGIVDISSDYVHHNYTADIRGSTFISNTATDHGGVVSGWNLNITVSKCTFIKKPCC